MLIGGMLMIRRNIDLDNSDSAHLNTLSDNSLIDLIRSGNESKQGRNAATVLISRYLNLVWKKACSFSGNYADVQDLSQEGLLALLKAISSFNPQNGVKFSAYANICIGNKLKSAVLKFNSASGSFSLEDSETDLPESASPESICLEKEFTENIYREISSMLSDKEWSVFKLYLEDLPYSEIAGKLNISEKSVDNAVFRVRRKLKSLLSPEHFQI